MHIESYLSHGADNVTTTEELKALTGVSARDIVQAVSDRRAAGVPILSSTNGGYYLPSLRPAAALMEIRSCITTLKNRGANTLKAARALRKHERRLADQVAGQLDLTVGGAGDV